MVLARLAAPVTGIAAVQRASTAPATGTALTSAGFGRTKSDWVPGRLHTGTFTTNAIDATTVAITGRDTDVVCKGDTGGPLLNTAGELVGVNSQSWQGGCLDANPAETRTNAIAVRVDDLGQWISQVTAPRRSAASNEAGGSERVRWADFDGDRKPDYITIADSGEVKVWLNRGGDPAGAGGWQPVGKVAGGLTTDRSRVRLADFDGDGKADYIVIDAGGSVYVYLNRGGDTGGGWQAVGKVAVGLTNDASKVRFADWDGDGKTDYIVLSDTGAVEVYLNRGGDTGGGWQGVGTVTTGATTDRTRIRFADNDGDGKADYYIVKPGGGIDLFNNRGGDTGGGWKPMGQIAVGLTNDHPKVQFVDFDADTHADYILGDANGGATVYSWNGGDGAGGWNGLGKVAGGA
ncbi:FG-GAP-like repeat-containing protein [Streptomyces sp. NPDC051183]|uniref:FG-GAP-like repeat-containing protein n=1 Tax=Streptomyces sp. NPDC051183 TaxID=3155165 RepID=UPI003425FF46